VDELVDDEQFRARHAIVEAVTGPTSTGGPDRFRQVGPVLAGMVAPHGPIEVGDPSRSDTDRLLGAAGMAPERIAELKKRGVVA
jgi:crotonobetainyl-CoA:carnitine CoA-transferase CaiB-like acyl-CoA transferase